MNTEPKPSAPDTLTMRQNLAQDAKTNRYSKEVLLAIMRCIDCTVDQYNGHPVNSSLQTVTSNHP